MKIVYTCYGGAHSSPIAAAIHMGLLPKDRIPDTEDFIKTRYYDKVDSADHGKLLPVGRDSDGNEVFVLGRGSANIAVINAVRSGWMLAGKSQKEVVFVDTLPTVNWFMRIGGFLSRSLGLVTLGRPFIVAGTRRAYPKMVQLVEDTKEALAKGAVAGVCRR